MKKNKISQIEIELNLKGQGKVLVDGKDISNAVTQVYLLSSSGEVPRVELVLTGDIKIKGEIEVSFFKENV